MPRFRRGVRTTLEGKCLVNGVPLLETEFASDPKTPIVSSRIAEIVALQSEIPVYEVFLQDVRRGGLSALLTAYAAEGEGIIVVDAVEERDLTLIAQAACEQPSMVRWIMRCAGDVRRSWISMPRAWCRIARNRKSRLS